MSLETGRILNDCESPEIVDTPMKVLFLHGLSSNGGSKTWFIRSLGYEVLAPKLSNWSFNGALQSAQFAFDQMDPDVVVGSSRGGAVAMRVQVGQTPLVLLAPSWAWCDVKPELRTNTVIIHSRFDKLVPISSSRELCSRNPNSQLIEVGKDHRLNDEQARRALKAALESLLRQ